MIKQQVESGRYADYRKRMQKIADIRFAVALMQWDMETYMPAGGANARAQQIATLSGMAHELFTDPQLNTLLLELRNSDELSRVEKKNIELSLYDYEQQRKVSTEFVQKLSEATSKSLQAWSDARKQNRFSIFEPHLKGLIDLKREEATLLGFEEHPYDALLNQYERGATVTMLDKGFSELVQPLTALLKRIREKQQVDDSFLRGNFPRDKQWQFGLDVLKKMHFDFEKGRQDISEHPFTTNMAATDVRVTTRVDEHDFANMTWSCIHEGGHALYEQGLPESEYGLPSGEYTSLSIHESQSRLWENNVGRSKLGWESLYPQLQETFPDAFGKISLSQFYAGINKVEPSLIRTEADELTYHFHVIIRYELEKRLIEGSLDCHDIPSFWNEKYKELLGVEPADDRTGCLQDVHWSHGSFGYFPTYSLGSLYAAQFYAAACDQVPGLEERIRKGDYKPLLNWLRISVHAHGRRYTSEELCTKITGEPLNIKHFMTYAVEKYTEIYRLT